MTFKHAMLCSARCTDFILILLVARRRACKLTGEVLGRMRNFISGS